MRSADLDHRRDGGLNEQCRPRRVTCHAGPCPANETARAPCASTCLVTHPPLRRNHVTTLCFRWHTAELQSELLLLARSCAPLLHEQCVLTTFMCTGHRLHLAAGCARRASRCRRWLRCLASPRPRPPRRLAVAAVAHPPPVDLHACRASASSTTRHRGCWNNMAQPAARGPLKNRQPVPAAPLSPSVQQRRQAGQVFCAQSTTHV